MKKCKPIPLSVLREAWVKYMEADGYPRESVARYWDKFPGRKVAMRAAARVILKWERGEKCS